MFYKKFIEELEKRGYAVAKGVDSYTLVFTTKNHELSNTLIELHLANDIIHYEFKRHTPTEIKLTGFVDSEKALKDRYVSFVNAIKLANKTLLRYKK